MEISIRYAAVLFCAFAVAIVGICPDLDSFEGSTNGENGVQSFGGDSPLTIPAAAFSTKGNDAESHTFVWWAGILKGTASPGGCVQAPVYVPRWATISEMWVSYIDNDAAQNMTVMLSRVSNWRPSDTGPMAIVVTGGASPDVLSDGDTTIDNDLVMFPDYSYYVTTCLPSEDTKLLSVRIWYLETAIFADRFERGDTSGWSGVQ